MDHVRLTLDGALDDNSGPRGAMRWMPPEQAATVRAAVQDATTTDRPTNEQTPLSRTAR